MLECGLLSHPLCLVIKGTIQPTSPFPPRGDREISRGVTQREGDSTWHPHGVGWWPASPRRPMCGVRADQPCCTASLTSRWEQKLGLHWCATGCVGVDRHIAVSVFRIPNMSSPRPHTLARLQEAVTDGRLANVFFRREQLYRLHEALLRSKDAIVNGIVKDSGNTAAEAFAELYATLSAIKSNHDQLQPETELEAEYRVAHGKDSPETRDGFGIVLVRPHAHTFVYSVLAPVSAALAAGNCVAVVVREVPENGLFVVGPNTD